MPDGSTLGLGGSALELGQSAAGGGNGGEEGSAWDRNIVDEPERGLEACVWSCVWTWV